VHNTLYAMSSCRVLLRAGGGGGKRGKLERSIGDFLLRMLCRRGFLPELRLQLSVDAIWKGREKEKGVKLSEPCLCSRADGLRTRVVQYYGYQGRKKEKKEGEAPGPCDDPRIQI